jgi:hypothetical protein
MYRPQNINDLKRLDKKINALLIQSKSLIILQQKEEKDEAKINRYWNWLCWFTSQGASRARPDRRQA